MIKRIIKNLFPKFERFIFVDVEVDTNRGTKDGKLLIEVSREKKKFRAYFIIPGMGYNRINLEQLMSVSKFKELKIKIQQAYEKPLNESIEIYPTGLL